MANKDSLVELHVLATTYGGRPSDWLGIDDPWLAYQLDLVTLLAARGKSEGQKFAPVGQAATAMKQEVKKMKVPESGIW